MSSEKDYDELMYPILCGEGNIVDFFDKIFDFLYRRTDFFKLKNDDSTLGLADGEAENIVRSVFCKYMEQAVSEQRVTPSSETEPILADCIAEEVVVSSVESDSTVVTPSEEKSPAPSVEENKKSNNDTDIGNKQHEDDKSDPKVPLMDPDSYNGASYEDYAWAQTLQDADIRIKVPKSISTGKEVRVLIQHTHLKVEYCMNGEWIVLKDKDLSWRINVEESTWTFVPREHIHICVQKIQDRWWDSCFVDEPKIDLKSIDPSIPYDELDESSQAKINELMYNEHQKRLGKPTIEQSKYQSILKEAWNCEGSPFKGQPFDPSLIDIQNNGSAVIGH